MKLKLTLKRLGKKKLKFFDFVVPKPPANLEELMTACVAQQVSEYNDKRQEASILPFLNATEIAAQSENGQVDFTQINNQTKVDQQTAINNALLAFEDGLFVVFIDDQEVTDLTAPLDLTEHTVVTFIRMTFLSGAYW